MDREEFPKKYEREMEEVTGGWRELHYEELCHILL
jgi:hypothetical protein